MSYECDLCNAIYVSKEAHNEIRDRSIIRHVQFIKDHPKDSMKNWQSPEGQAKQANRIKCQERD